MEELYHTAKERPNDTINLHPRHRQRTPSHPPLTLPADCIEILCHCGFDQRIIEQCMKHLMAEYGPDYSENCGTNGGGEQ